MLWLDCRTMLLTHSPLAATLALFSADVTSNDRFNGSAKSAWDAVTASNATLATFDVPLTVIATVCFRDSSASRESKWSWFMGSCTLHVYVSAGAKEAGTAQAVVTTLPAPWICRLFRRTVPLFTAVTLHSMLPAAEQADGHKHSSHQANGFNFCQQ